jgi:hypothetical protein
MATTAYPVRVEASLDRELSRWLWLVKWLLAIPHYIVLAFLWIVFIVVSVVAFFAILVTGRYPRTLFEFNVGVLRWTWRVSYYTYGALGTDRYPPFSLADEPDYPAHLDVAYPEHLSRGLVLVKWWLLAIPHYLVAGLFIGGGTWAVSQYDNNGWAPGLIGLLVIIAAVVLAFTGRYPEPIFDFVLGMNRWVLRVAAYAGLMVDDYPPFRLDMGGPEPGGTMTGSSASTAALRPTTAAPPPTGRRGWTAGRIVSLVIGSVVGLISLALLAGGGVAAWADNTQRDAAGYLATDVHRFTTASYAITSDEIDLGSGTSSVTPADLLGTVRIRATATNPASAIFIGVAPKASADQYLNGVSRDIVNDWTDGAVGRSGQAGAAPRTSPIVAPIWTVKSFGRGTQTLTWKPEGGTWTVVVMNANAAAGVSFSADIGASIPDLGWIAVGLLVGGGLLLVGAVLLIVIPVVRASRRTVTVGEDPSPSG